MIFDLRRYVYVRFCCSVTVIVPRRSHLPLFDLDDSVVRYVGCCSTLRYVPRFRSVYSVVPTDCRYTAAVPVCYIAVTADSGTICSRIHFEPHTLLALTRPPHSPTTTTYVTGTLRYHRTLCVTPFPLLPRYHVIHSPLPGLRPWGVPLLFVVT